MTCDEVIKELEQQMDRATDSKFKAQVSQHLKNCGLCHEVEKKNSEIRQRLSDLKDRIQMPASMRNSIAQLLTSQAGTHVQPEYKEPTRLSVVRETSGKQPNPSSCSEPAHSENVGVDTETAANMVPELVSELLRDRGAELSPRERDILRLRFGCEDGVSRTHEQVAELLGVTRERVRQIEVKALRKIRDPNSTSFRPRTS